MGDYISRDKTSVAVIKAAVWTFIFYMIEAPRISMDMCLLVKFPVRARYWIFRAATGAGPNVPTYLTSVTSYRGN